MRTRSSTSSTPTHARALWKRGPRSYLGAVFSPEPLKRLGAVGGLGAALAAGYFLVVAPSVQSRPLPFHMEQLEA